MAKGANFVWRGGGELSDYLGRGEGELDLAPLVAVPTTAGTGTEVQSFALIADEETHAKMAIATHSSFAHGLLAQIAGSDSVHYAIEVKINFQPISCWFFTCRRTSICMVHLYGIWSSFI